MAEKNGNVVAFDLPASYWLQKARNSRMALKHTDAARLLRHALRQKPASGDAVTLELANTYHDMQCYRACSQTLVSLLAADPYLSDGYFLLAKNLSALGAHAAACDALDIYLRLCPDSEQAYDARDMLWQWSERFEPSTPERGERSRTLMRRAYARHLAGRGSDSLRDAFAAYRKSRRKETAAALSALLLHNGQQKAALFFARDAAKRGGHAFHYQQLLCRAYIANGMRTPASAMLTLMCAGARFEQAETLCELALNAGCGHIAQDMLRRMRKRAPSSADIAYLQAAMLASLGDRAGAERALRDATELDPSDETARYCALHPELPPPLSHCLPSEVITSLALARARETDVSPASAAMQMIYPFRQAPAEGMLLSLAQSADTTLLRQALLSPLSEKAHKLCLLALTMLGEQPPYIAFVDGRLRLLEAYQSAAAEHDHDLSALTHLLALWLRDTFTHEQIFSFVRPLWHMLPAAARAHCAARVDFVWPCAFAMYILQENDIPHACERYGFPGRDKKRVLRALAQLRDIAKRGQKP